MRPLLLLMLLLSLALLGFSGVAAQEETDLTARLRVIHVADGVPPVDVYINGTLAVQNLAAGQASPHFTVAAGPGEVALREGGSTAEAPVLLSQSVDLLSDLAFSLVVQGEASAPEMILYEDILDSVDSGFARLAVINAVPGAGNLDIIRSDGAPLMLSIPYGTQYGTINIPAGFYELLAVPNEGTVADALAEVGVNALESNVLYTLVISPDGEASSALVLPSLINAPEDSAPVSFVHDAEEGPAVDVYVDDVLVVPSLAYASASEMLPLATGDHTVSLREAGTPPNSEAIFSSDLSVSAGMAHHLVFTLEEGELDAGLYSQSLAAITTEQAHVQLLNLSDETLAVDALATEALDGASSPIVTLDPADYALTEDIEQLFLGGILYHLIVFDADNAILKTTPLNVTLNSTPFGAAVEVAASPEESESPTEEAAPDETTEATPDTAAESTPAGELIVAASPTPDPNATSPVQAIPTTEVDVVQPPADAAGQPTAAAVVPPTTVPPAAGGAVAPDPNVPRAVVTLNQGVNLQCREYPSTQARSLNLIPNNTEMVVEGVIAPRDETGENGGRVDAMTLENVPDFTPILTEEVGWDSIPQATKDLVSTLDLLWVNVTFQPQPGQFFGCWVNALYIRTNYKNQLIDTVEKYVVNLVEQGGAEFVPYNVPGGPRDPETFAPSSVPPAGNTAATPAPAAATPTSAPAAAATVDPNVISGRLLINPGAQLNLRDRPSTDGIVRIGIPQDAVLVVNGRNGDGTWLDVTYITPSNTLNGWVAAEFVALGFQGTEYELRDLPITTGEPDAMTSTP